MLGTATCACVGPARPRYRQRIAVLTVLLVGALLHPPAAAEEVPGEVPPAATAADPPSPPAAIEPADLARFLDRLMLAESGGRDDARNPRSTAIGPFQFIESTFLEVTQRHFQAETGALASAEVLKLRTNRAFSRRVAEAFTRDNAGTLAAAGLSATFANLRLAFLAGADGAIRVLKADPQAMAIAVLGRKAAQANPFMAGMSIADLVRWSARNIALSGLVVADWGAGPRPGAGGTEQSAPPKQAIAVHCNQNLASCRRWVALASQRLERPQIVGSRSRRLRP